jgi:hypothetical protein
MSTFTWESRSLDIGMDLGHHTTREMMATKENLLSPWWVHEYQKGQTKIK